MKTSSRIQWRRWMLALGAAAALGGGAAYALGRDCWRCAPCGCSEDGGNLMCCDATTC